MMTRLKSFAKTFNFYKLFWLFFIASFLGVVLESIWCILTRGGYESRTGLIYGPFNLVYGFGALSMTICLQPLAHKRDKIIFLGGFLVGSLFEYLCSFLQEQFLGTISWDYSDFWFNINGKVNLLYSCFWGLLAIAWIRWLLPKISNWIESIPRSYRIPLSWILVIFMVFNVGISYFALHRQAERRELIPPDTSFEVWLDLVYPDERLAKIYPNMIYLE